MDYGMQLGSGTWDFKPSLTYTGQWQQFSWGAQTSGTVRMENRNQSGYALGDLFQTTAWGSYNFTNWLAGSLRGLYTAQGAIKGQYNGSYQSIWARGLSCQLRRQLLGYRLWPQRDGALRRLGR